MKFILESIYFDKSIGLKKGLKYNVNRDMAILYSWFSQNTHHRETCLESTTDMMCRFKRIELRYFKQRFSMFLGAIAKLMENKVTKELPNWIKGTKNLYL